MAELPHELPPEWNPPKGHEELVRNTRTGELGWLVRRSGQSMVRLDRPNQEILHRYVESDWLPEVPRRPLARAHLARVALEADRELCRALGNHDGALRTWQRMDEYARKKWVEKGPAGNSARMALYAAIMGALEPYTRGEL